MIVAVCVVIFGAAVLASSAQSDEVTALPGWTGPLPSRMWSGYLNISATKHMHYIFVEAQAPVDPATAPVVLWTNGGPGCSSLDGFFYEHGPFRLNSATNPPTLEPFEFSWSKVANMLYLEAPVGVGFSYSDNPSVDYKCTDDTTAQDNLKSLEVFFALFPQFTNNDLFLTGESYSGIYTPTLAEAILWAAGNKTYTGAPLKGIGVGNGCTGTTIGVCGGQRDQYDAEFLIGTALVDPVTKAGIRTECPPSNYSSPACLALLAEMSAQVGHVDLYNIYGPCISGSGAQLAGSGHGKYKAPLGATRLRGPDACIDSILASEYVNQPAVQSALHVRPLAAWSVCHTEPGWSYDSTRPNLPRDTYPFLIASIRVLIYNGDWDACVPWTDNWAWTEGMGYARASAWHPWTYNLTFEGEVSAQVGGYAVRYAANDFTFITVKGGRHEVPETAPEGAFEMITRLTSGVQF